MIYFQKTQLVIESVFSIFCYMLLGVEQEGVDPVRFTHQIYIMYVNFPEKLFC